MPARPDPASASSPAQRYAAFRRQQAEDGPALTRFQALYDFSFDAFQREACRALDEGHGVLVAAPTGSGKTVVGEFAVHLALAEGRKCFYTTPVKALSNQKYGDLVRRYGTASVGLLTGDNSINGEAPVVVMTTEVLRNMLYGGSATLAGLGYVVLDEVHYLADAFRGAVWEEVIIHLPESVLVVALSATVSNAEEFGDWLTQVRGGTTVIVDEHRPVPLWQHMLAGGRLYDLFVTDDGAAGQVNPELLRLARRELWGPRPGRGPARFRPPRRPEVIGRLDAAGLLPAITFIFSRAGCDAAVRQCLDAGLRLTTPDEAAAITEIAEQRTAAVPESDLPVLGYGEWLSGLQRGIAAHHAGMLPTFKEVVEELFESGLVRAVFATETLALGINMPARTVVIERLDKWNGETHLPLTPGEYTQLTGRAGRRGIDVEGHAVVLWHPGMDPAAVAGLAGTRTYPLNSSFRPSYNMAVNLVGQAGLERAAALLESSFAQFQADRAVVGIARQARRGRQALAAGNVSCDRGDFAEYARLRKELSDLEGAAARQRSSARRAEALRSLQALRRGDIIQVPGGRRAGIAVVLDPGLSPAGRKQASRKGVRGGGRPEAALPAGSHEDGSPLPLVLTAGRQVKRLSAADFPEPATVLDRVRIPGAFSPRSPRARRDLAATVRNKLAGQTAGGGRDGRGAGQPPGDGAAPHRAGAGRPGAGQSGPGQPEIARLRRRLRQHPCHACPDREEHARQAERHARLEREVQQLEAGVAGRSHVIARTFQRVCAVLGQLGYLDGDTVTADGRRLADLYTELDLLAAECLRRGLWSGLDPAGLAACVSALTFEARKAEDAAPPRLPGGPAREVLAAMVSVWAELSAVEQEHKLAFLREPDLGFAWAAHAWARGKPLESVLGPDLTPGDFVRAVKQLMDLLGQIAVAAGRGTPLGVTARQAVDALRHGVVAYSSVG
ncbi:MAG TPA: DEAD/DEAH box helicase [Streptosporangiaceae bacterium]|nr:DEAD/DEAH box helicase [Streptosporangiaceae bacterium]